MSVTCTQRWVIWSDKRNGQTEFLPPQDFIPEPHELEGGFLRYRSAAGAAENGSGKREGLNFIRFTVREQEGLNIIGEHGLI